MFIGEELCDFKCNHGEVQLKIIEQNAWLVYIDEYYDLLTEKMHFGQVWEGLEDQIIGVYRSEKDADTGIADFYKQADRMCE